MAAGEGLLLQGTQAPAPLPQAQRVSVLEQKPEQLPMLKRVPSGGKTLLVRSDPVKVLKSMGSKSLLGQAGAEGSLFRNRHGDAGAPSDSRELQSRESPML